MRIGILGGTFDPVHLGHLILAEQCREQARLDQVWFMPAARPPHKLEADLTPFAHRVDMLRLAIAGQPAFRVEEIERAQPGPSYTALTLEELHRRDPKNQWFLAVGGDALRDLPDWYEPQRIVALAELLVMQRTGAAAPAPQELQARLGCLVRVHEIQAPRIDIASRDVRQRVREGRSIRYLTPRAVEMFIQDKHLYHPGPASETVR